MERNGIMVKTEIVQTETISLEGPRTPTPFTEMTPLVRNNIPFNCDSGQVKPKKVRPSDGQFLSLMI